MIEGEHDGCCHLLSCTSETSSSFQVWGCILDLVEFKSSLAYVDCGLTSHLRSKRVRVGCKVYWWHVKKNRNSAKHVVQECMRRQIFWCITMTSWKCFHLKMMQIFPNTSQTHHSYQHWFRPISANGWMGWIVQEAMFPVKKAPGMLWWSSPGRTTSGNYFLFQYTWKYIQTSSQQDQGDFERIGMLSSYESTGNYVCPRREDASSNRIFEEQNNHVGPANQVWIFETTWSLVCANYFDSQKYWICTSCDHSVQKGDQWNYETNNFHCFPWARSKW
jgi:hypothetical protein